MNTRNRIVAIALSGEADGKTSKEDERPCGDDVCCGASVCKCGASTRHTAEHAGEGNALTNDTLRLYRIIGQMHDQIETLRRLRNWSGITLKAVKGVKNH